MRFVVIAALLAFTVPTARAGDGCYPVPKTPNTPTGIAGCVRWGSGIASEYGPGHGVAMNSCTWVRRHSSGCGWVTITSVQSGRSVTVPVIDFCDCFTGTPDERIVDLQYGVRDALGLNPSAGLWPVLVEPARGAGAASPQTPRPVPAPSFTLPDTAT